MEHLFTASWTNGTGYTSSSTPLPWKEAHTWLLKEMRHNADRWQRINPSAPEDTFRTAIGAIENMPSGKSGGYSVYGYEFGVTRI